MNENRFMRVDDVARELGVSKSYAYKLIQRLNAELREKGYLTISGWVSRRYFTEKLCYGETERGGGVLQAFRNKENGSRYVQFRYTDWRGERKQKL